MGDVSPGQVVTLTDGRQATVRFVGPTHFAAGDWIGIELDEGTGKNDGAVQGERYFDCEPGFGMFIRPTAVVSVAEPPPARDGKQPLKNNGNPTAAPRGRPQSSMVPGGLGIKKPSGLSATNVKRHSATASPSPAPKVATTPRTLRSPTKSPTKQLSSTSGPPSSRMSMGGAPRPSPAITPKARPTPSTRTSMGPPPPLPTTSSKRPSLSGPAGRTTRPPSQTMSSGPSGLSKRPAIQPNLTKRPSETADGGRDGQADDPESPGRDGESGLAEGITSQVTRRTSGTARPNASRPSLSPLAQRQAQSNALTRELDELKTKLKVMEKKRAEDREKLKNLEKLQTERDKFESIIQKLQAKYQPQQLEIGDLRKKLKDAETRLEEVERLQAEHESLMEMASLDREMAEETADAFKHECETLRLKVEELQLEVEVLREENEELGQVMSPEEKSTQGWLQMEKSNERLREALIRLRDMTQQQESELRDQIKELEEDLEDYRAVKAQYETTKEKLLVSETNVEDLKQQLETALGAEEMIEELADKNMRYQEEINELKAAIEDLESLKEISDELEYTHIETEKQLQEEIDYKDTLFSEQNRKIAQQDELIEDLEYTLSRFRELVSTLQTDLEDMRASQQISEAEANDLTTRSRAMMDLNMKLQASVSKAQTKTIDIEINRMEAEEAMQHLSILKNYLPEYFDSERNSILALLRFKRISFKAGLMNTTIRERVSEQAASSIVHEDIFPAMDVIEKVLWISLLSDRFINFLGSCSAEAFVGFEGALFELEPVERTINFWLEGLKRNEIDMKKCADELSRSIALLSHLAETLLPLNLETFADELCMGSHLTLSYLDHAATSIARLKSLVQGKLPTSAEDDGENAFLFGKMDTFVSQTRGLKVAMGKISRSLDDLRSRSLTLSSEATEPFKQTEDAAKALSALARSIGDNVALLLGEEGRAEPWTLGEIQDTMSQALVSFDSASGSETDKNDALSVLSNRLRALGSYLEDLDSISNDLSLTTEFERLSAPWVARAQELKSNKTISPDADEEIRRLKNEIHEASTALGVKDKTLEEQAIKVELLESRMREANKKAAMVKELETRIEEMQTAEVELQEAFDKQKKDLQAAEAERDDYQTRFEKVKRVSGTVGLATTADGVVVDAGVSLAAMRENEALRTEVESLQAAVRYLREENRRNNLLDAYSVQRSADLYSWLDAPLTQAKASAEREKVQQTASETRDVFAHLLKLTQESCVPDLKATISTPGDSGSNRLAWRPSKSRLRYQVLQQRENFERWTEWRDDIVSHEREQDRVAAAKKERMLREQAQRHARLNSELEFPKGLGHGMMGRAWQILGMQRDDERKASLAGRPGGVVDIVSPD